MNGITSAALIVAANLAAVASIVYGSSGGGGWEMNAGWILGLIVLHSAPALAMRNAGKSR